MMLACFTHYPGAAVICCIEAPYLDSGEILLCTTGLGVLIAHEAP